MKILVAGGAGFLGSHLVEELLQERHEIHVVDDLSSGLIKNIQRVLDKITFSEADIIDFKTSQKYDIIINLASRASRVEWETYPVEVALTNSVGNDNLIRLALDSNALYVFASTSEVYGSPELVPTPESYLGRVSSVGSRSPYDESKRFGEALVKAYGIEYKLRHIILRLFNTYGPRMRGGDLYGRVLDRFIQQAISGSDLTVYGDGNQTRSFTYVKDTVKGIMAVIKDGKEGGIYNIGNDEETKIRDLAMLIKQITKSNSEIVYRPLPPDDPARRAADISQIRELGWNPAVGLQEGIQLMLSYESEKD